MADVQEYHAGTMQGLFQDLQGFRTALETNGSDMKTASDKLATAWAENEALGAFQSTYQKWDTEFSDTLIVLDKIAAAVENALHRALGTDGKIGDGFADI